MGGVTKEQIAQAKQVDLLSYLQAYEPHSLKKTAPNEYCLREHDSLKISNGKWHWFSQNIGGKTALDFLIHVRGVDFVEAVKALTDGRIASYSSFQSVKKQVQQTIQPETQFTLPTQNKDNARVIAYLQSRGIDREIIDRCCIYKQDIIASLTVPNYHLIRVCSCMLSDKNIFVVLSHSSNAPIYC